MPLYPLPHSPTPCLWNTTHGSKSPQRWIVTASWKLELWNWTKMKDSMSRLLPDQTTQEPPIATTGSKSVSVFGNKLTRIFARQVLWKICYNGVTRNRWQKSSTREGMGRKQGEQGSHCELRWSSRAKAQTTRGETLYSSLMEKRVWAGLDGWGTNSQRLSVGATLVRGGKPLKGNLSNTSFCVPQQYWNY